MELNTEVDLDWPCESVVASKKAELAVSRVLHRKGEWGRGRDLPKHRLDEISLVCEAHGMTLYQSLSLRRSMLRAKPGGMHRMSTSASMGSPQGQRKIAQLFEDAVLSFVRSAIGSGASSLIRTEADLQAEMRAGRIERGPTPDILFVQPIRINGRWVKWIDAKLYYASAMLFNEPRIPNGKLRRIAERYNQHFGGTGAFVFGQGFCLDLAQHVQNALLLDATPLDMSAVSAFQNAST